MIHIQTTLILFLYNFFIYILYIIGSSNYRKEVLRLKVVGFSIKEQISKNGKSYNALYIVTDDKDNPEKLIGYVNAKSIKCLPLEKKEEKN